MFISDFFQLAAKNACALTLVMWPRFNYTKSENNRLREWGKVQIYKKILLTWQWEFKHNFKLFKLTLVLWMFSLVSGVVTYL